MGIGCDIVQCEEMNGMETNESVVVHGFLPLAPEGMARVIGSMPDARASTIFFASVFKDLKRLSIAHLVQSPPNALAISRHWSEQSGNGKGGC
jgi:hypothetical protein